MNIFIGYKPNRHHLQALSECRTGHSHLQALFASALEDTKKALVRAEDSVNIHRLQGTAKALQDFLDAVETSSEVLARVDSPQ